MIFVIALVLFSLVYALQIYYQKLFFMKVVAVTLLFVISSGVYFSFDSYKGWPSSSNPVEGSEVLNIVVVEPTENSIGAIYVLVNDKVVPQSFLNRMLDYRPDTPKAPRSYYIPYSKPTGAEYSEAGKKLKKGFKVTIGDNEKKAETEGDGSGGGGDQKDYRVPSLKIISPQEVLAK